MVTSSSSHTSLKIVTSQEIDRTLELILSHIYKGQNVELAVSSVINYRSGSLTKSKYRDLMIGCINKLGFTKYSAGYNGRTTHSQFYTNIRTVEELDSLASLLVGVLKYHLRIQSPSYIYKYMKKEGIERRYDSKDSTRLDKGTTIMIKEDLKMRVVESIDILMILTY